MGKIEKERENTKYARVMHHIGGISGKNDNSDMIRGGEDSLNLLSQDQLSELNEKGIDVARLIRLGSLREATENEVIQFEVATGIRSAAPDSEFFANFTTGNEALHPELGQTGGAVGANAETNSKEPGTAGGGAGTAGNLADTVGNTGASTGGNPSGGSLAYKGMTKGELSEYSVPELKDMAKEENVEGYTAMTKEPLLAALLALGK